MSSRHIFFFWGRTRGDSYRLLLEGSRDSAAAAATFQGQVQGHTAPLQLLGTRHFILPVYQKFSGFCKNSFIGNKVIIYIKRKSLHQCPPHSPQPFPLARVASVFFKYSKQGNFYNVFSPPHTASFIFMLPTPSPSHRSAVGSQSHQGLLSIHSVFPPISIS